MESGSTQPPEGRNRLGMEERSLGGAAGSDFMSVLETVSQIHVSARPELQGKKCVCVSVCRKDNCSADTSPPGVSKALLLQVRSVFPRRIYSITTHGSRSQLLVAVEGECSAPCVLTENNDPVWWCYSVYSHSLLNVSLLPESSCVCLQCCGPARACTLKVFDCQGCQLFYFERPFRADACCLGCCLMEMSVYTPQKHLIGTVCQR